MRAKIFFHGNCFDGASSAALFTEFYRRRHQGAEVRYRAMAHQVGDPFADCALDGDDNICVDFRYCPDLRMNWWFDHHVSGFQPKELRKHFEANPSEQKIFDPSIQSCAVLLRDSLRERFSFLPDDPKDHWSQLIDWADKIDGAAFATAKEAVEIAEPALEVMTWLAHHEGSEQVVELISQLGHRSLADIASQDWIQGPLAAIRAHNTQVRALISERAEVEEDVIYYDVVSAGLVSYNKFIAYMLFPHARYTVGVSASDSVAKLSVGSNPWSGQERTHDLAAICERYGGGGHPVVGGISRPRSELERIREIGREIVSELLSN